MRASVALVARAATRGVSIVCIAFIAAASLASCAGRTGLGGVAPAREVAAAPTGTPASFASPDVKGRTPANPAALPLALRVLLPKPAMPSASFHAVRFELLNAPAEADPREPFRYLRVQRDDAATVLIDRVQLLREPAGSVYSFEVPIGSATSAQLSVIDANGESARITAPLRVGGRTPSMADRWLPHTLWSPATRDIADCRAIKAARDVLDHAPSHAEQLLADADRGVGFRRGGRLLLNDEFQVLALTDVEAATTVLFGMNSQWASAEQFLRGRQALTFPPIDRSLVAHLQGFVSAEIAVRQRVLALLLEAVRARGAVPMSRFYDFRAERMHTSNEYALQKSSWVLARGVDPKAKRRASDPPTVSEAWDATFDALRRGAIAGASRHATEAGVTARGALATEFSSKCRPATWPSDQPKNLTVALSRVTPQFVDQLIDVDRSMRALADATRAATLLEAVNRFDDAFILLDAAVAIDVAMLGAAHPVTVEARAALARVQGRRGRIDEAAQLWQGWVGASQRALSEELWMTDEEARRDVLRNNRRNVDAFLQSLVRTAPGDAASQALALSVARKGLLARVAGELNALSKASNDPATQRALRELEAQRRRLAGVLWKPDADTAALRVERARLAELEVALALRVRPRRSGAALPSVAELQAALGADEALVDFQVYRDAGTSRAGPTGARPGEHLVAVVLRRSGLPTIVTWPDFAAMTAAIARYRALIDPDSLPSARRPAELDAATRHLSRSLWAPLEAALGGARRVSLSPDGALSLVPFPALLASDGAFLASRLDLQLLTSPRDLMLRTVAPASRKAMVVGAPNYGESRMTTPAADRDSANSTTRPRPRSRTIAGRLQDLVFEPLPGALEESQQVAAIVRPAYAPTLLTGNAATEQALYKARGPAVLHLATHGFFLDDVDELESGSDPMQALAHSGLSLAHANAALQGGAGGAGGAEDGILTALEATTLDLRGTRLVVLSACDTGLGRIEAGEGVHGLMRAFSEAGAQSVLATLWPVDDAATREFMLGFYRRFVAGQAPSAALRAMQLEFIAHPVWRDPHYWAPFVLVGH